MSETKNKIESELEPKVIHGYLCLECNKFHPHGRPHYGGPTVECCGKSAEYYRLVLEDDFVFQNRHKIAMEKYRKGEPIKDLCPICKSFKHCKPTGVDQKRVQLYGCFAKDETEYEFSPIPEARPEGLFQLLKDESLKSMNDLGGMIQRVEDSLKSRPEDGFESDFKFSEAWMKDLKNAALGTRAEATKDNNMMEICGEFPSMRYEQLIRELLYHIVLTCELKTHKHTYNDDDLCDVCGIDGRA